MTKFEDIEGKLREIIAEEVHSLAFGLHIMNEKLLNEREMSFPQGDKVLFCVKTFY
jgi:hypothetical protein